MVLLNELPSVKGMSAEERATHEHKLAIAMHGVVREATQKFLQKRTEQEQLDSMDMRRSMNILDYFTRAMGPRDAASIEPIKLKA